MRDESSCDPAEWFDECYESAIKNGDCPDCGERIDSPKCCCYS